MIFLFIVHENKGKMAIFHIRFAFVGVIIIINDEKGHFGLFFRVPLDIKQQYLKSQYFVDVIKRKQFPL